MKDQKLQCFFLGGGGLGQLAYLRRGILARKRGWCFWGGCGVDNPMHAMTSHRTKKSNIFFNIHYLHIVHIFTLSVFYKLFIYFLYTLYIFTEIFFHVHFYIFVYFNVCMYIILYIFIHTLLFLYIYIYIYIVLFICLFVNVSIGCYFRVFHIYI